MLKFLAKGEISKGNYEGKMRLGLKTFYRDVDFRFPRFSFLGISKAGVEGPRYSQALLLI